MKVMIGVDPHKGTHTAVAVEGRTSESLSEFTVRARDEGHERLLGWADALFRVAPDQRFDRGLRTDALDSAAAHP